MRIEYSLQPALPCMAWVAEVDSASGTALVRHGNRVEATPDWCIEGVWAGHYTLGGFDQTDLIFGSGVRMREDGLVFVSSGTTVDVLWYCERRGRSYVSNSLHCLLSVVGSRLLTDYPNYHRGIESITRGHGRYITDFPADDGNIHLIAFDNIEWRNGALRPVPKPLTSGPFPDFETYRSFLFASATAIGENAADSRRVHSIRPLTTISSGYDSAVAALVSRETGCQRSVTFTVARARRHRSDSGEKVAEYLGLTCTAYPRNTKQIHDEIYFWAAEGELQDGNMSHFEYPGPVCLLFTGFHGGRVWDRKRHDVSTPFVRGDSSGRGFSEYRLVHGIIHCVVPYWGAFRAADIQNISFADDMTPWSVAGSYDRPVSRRLLETAGVPRDCFGTVKSATSLDQEYPFPVSRDLQQRFVSYARSNGVRLPNPAVDRFLHNFDRDILGALRQRIPWLRIRRSQHSNRIAHSLLFAWANNELATSLASARALPGGILAGGT